MGLAGVSVQDAALLCESLPLCTCFEAALAVCGNARECANWLLSDCLAILNKRKETADELKLDGRLLGKLILLVLEGNVGRANARKILEEMFLAPVEPAVYAERMGYLISRDEGQIEEVIRAVIAENPRALADYRAGNRVLFHVLRKRRKRLSYATLTRPQTCLR